MNEVTPEESPHKWTGPHPADRDIGALYPYYECDYCGACSRDPSEHDPECPA